MKASRQESDNFEGELTSTVLGGTEAMSSGTKALRHFLWSSTSSWFPRVTCRNKFLTVTRWGCFGKRCQRELTLQKKRMQCPITNLWKTISPSCANASRILKSSPLTCVSFWESLSRREMQGAEKPVKHYVEVQQPGLNYLYLVCWVDQWSFQSCSKDVSFGK